MKVALIYEVVGEKLQVFVIDNPSKDEIEHLEKSNYKLVNSHSLTESMQFVYDKVANDWGDFEVKFPFGPVDQVYYSGFVA